MLARNILAIGSPRALRVHAAWNKKSGRGGNRMVGFWKKSLWPSPASGCHAIHRGQQEGRDIYIPMPIRRC